MVDVQLLAATLWFWTFLLGFLYSIVVYLVLLFTPLCFVLVPYAIWIWYDRKTCEKGGRSVKSIRKLKLWQLVKNYFRYELKTDGNVKLDPKKNYIFGCFPHGICPLGAYAAFIDGYQNFFPDHKPHTTALTIQFWTPFIRELFLSIGSVAVTAPSLKYLIKKESGGNIVSIIIGGAEEAKYSKAGLYKIILNKRKGFIKMALENGTPIVPVYTFGENEIFEAFSVPGTGIILPKGRYGILPNQVKITTVVGQPIEVDKLDKPTKEDVESLHDEFVQSMIRLFEKNKHKYVKNPEKAHLVIV